MNNARKTFDNFKQSQGIDDTDEFNSVKLSKSLFEKLIEPACFNVWSKSNADIDLQNEKECRNKWIITYRKAFEHLKTLE